MGRSEEEWEKFEKEGRILNILLLVALLAIVLIIVLGMLHVIDLKVTTGNPINDYFLNKLLFGK